jgi:hypothetical protein
LSDYDPDCLKCEEVMQPYLDRVLDDAQVREAEAHLDACSYCRQRYRFESRFAATSGRSPPRSRCRSS